jgi:hypothetical protein
MTRWSAFEVVGAADPVNHAWQPTQQELTRLLGEGWSAQIQHSGPCAGDLCGPMPCPPIFSDDPRRYRAVLVVPVHAEGYADLPVKAFDNLVRALS